VNISKTAAKHCNNWVTPIETSYTISRLGYRGRSYFGDWYCIQWNLHKHLWHMYIFFHSVMLPTEFILVINPKLCTRTWKLCFFWISFWKWNLNKIPHIYIGTELNYSNTQEQYKYINDLEKPSINLFN